jgi:hypothetical protein
MEYPALEKFIDRMGITYSIKTGPVILLANPKNPFNRTLPRICVEISVQYKGETQYEQIHCYTLNEFGFLVYKEGSIYKSISDGVLAYLGEDDKVEEYFDQLSREKALKKLKLKGY